MKTDELISNLKDVLVTETEPGHLTLTPKADVVQFLRTLPGVKSDVDAHLSALADGMIVQSHRRFHN